MLQADNQRDEGPGRLIGVRPRGLGAQRLRQAIVQALYACLAQVLSSVTAVGDAGGHLKTLPSAAVVPDISGLLA
jgi:hypothetical protein